MREFSSPSHVGATQPSDHAHVSSWLKTLLVMIVVVPMTMYVAGSLVASQAGEPADRSPVIIEDPRSPTSEDPRRTTGKSGGGADDVQREDRRTPVATPSPRPTSVPTSVATRTPPPVPTPTDEARDDESARVVTPKPTPVDDDEGPDDRDEDDDTITDEDDDDDAEDGGGDNDEDDRGPDDGSDD